MDNSKKWSGMKEGVANEGKGERRHYRKIKGGTTMSSRATMMNCAMIKSNHAMMNNNMTMMSNNAMKSMHNSGDKDQHLQE